MLATITALLAMASGATCPGADPAITKVTKSQAAGSDLNAYTLEVTVTNLGSVRQPGNTLQSVVIYLDGQKKDEKGLPPLAPRQTYSFPYVVHRNSDAARGSTSVRFHIVVTQPAGTCTDANDTKRILI
jgi:hypothetical protein